MKRFVFYMQCDKFRQQAGGEEMWQEMMRNASRITQQEFEEACDTNYLLDQDETLEDFIASDPSSYFARSVIGTEVVYFVATCGFEFIFRST